MSKTIVIINGPGGSGKDTYTKMCRLFLHQINIPVYTISSITPVKIALRVNGHWDGKTKDESYRRLMAQTKRDMVAQGDLPLKYCLDECGKIEEGMIFLHIREPNEIKKACEAFLAEFGSAPITLHYERQTPSMERFESGVDLASETRAYPNYDYDILNEVDGLEYMAGLIRKFLTKIFNRSDIPEKINLTHLGVKKFHQEYDDHMRENIA